MNNAGEAEGYDGGMMDIEALWAAFHERVRHWLVGMVGNAGDPDDLTICVFARAWERRDRYDARHGSVCTWLYTITHNIAYSSVRKKRVWTRSLDLVAEESGPSREEPVARHEAAVTRERVWGAVAELPEMEGKVMSLLYQYGYTLRQVAPILGVSLRTAKFHKARALVLLHEKLAQK